MKEIWKVVDGYGGMYEVSNLGSVRSWHKSIGRRPQEVPHLLRPGKTLSGYRFVGLYDGEGMHRNELVHKLVAEAFICARPGNRTVNHIDRNKDNNRIDNLEWLSHTENIRHSARVIPRNRGEANHSKLKEADVIEMRQLWDARKATTSELGKRFNVSSVTAWQIVRRKKWKHVK